MMSNTSAAQPSITTAATGGRALSPQPAVQLQPPPPQQPVGLQLYGGVGIREALSHLSSRDLGRVATTCSRLYDLVNSMVNSLPVSELSSLIERGIAASTSTTTTGGYPPRITRSVRKVIACELIENYKLGFQASSGRALWPHFQRLVAQVAKTIRDAGAGNVQAGLQACTVDRLNERLGWLCVHARLCSDFLHTDWLLRQHDLAYLASQGVIFAREFMWNSKFPIACQKHVHKGPLDRNKEDEGEDDLQSQPGAMAPAAPATAAPAPTIATAAGAVIPRLTIAATVKTIQSAMASANVIASSAANDSNIHCLYCHPLAFLTQRCVFDVVNVLRRSEASVASGGSESVDELLSIIKYSAAFMPHLTSSAERRVVRLMVIHILRKARPPKYVGTNTTTNNPLGLSRSLSFSHLPSQSHAMITTTLPQQGQQVHQAQPQSQLNIAAHSLMPPPAIPLHDKQHTNDKHVGIGITDKAIHGPAGVLLMGPHVQIRRQSFDMNSSSAPGSSRGSRDSSPSSSMSGINFHSPAPPTAAFSSLISSASTSAPSSSASPSAAPATGGGSNPSSGPSTPLATLPNGLTASSLMPPPSQLPIHHPPAVPGGLPTNSTPQHRVSHHVNVSPISRQSYGNASGSVGPSLGRTSSMPSQVGQSSRATHSTSTVGADAVSHFPSVRETTLKHIRIDTGLDSPHRNLIQIASASGTPVSQSQTQTPTNHPSPLPHSVSAMNISMNQPSQTLHRGGSSNALQSLPSQQQHSQHGQHSHQQHQGGYHSAHPSSSHSSVVNGMHSSLAPSLPVPLRSVSPNPINNVGGGGMTSTATQQQQTAPSTNAVITTSNQSASNNNPIMTAARNSVALQLLRAVIATDLLGDELILNEVLAQQHDHQLDRKRSKPSRYHVVQQPSIPSYHGGGAQLASTTASDSTNSTPATSPTSTNLVKQSYNINDIGTGGTDDEIDQYLSFGSSYVIESS